MSNWKSHDTSHCSVKRFEIPSESLLFQVHNLKHLCEDQEHNLCNKCNSAYTQECLDIAKLLKLSLDEHNKISILDVHAKLLAKNEEASLLGEEGNTKELTFKWVPTVEKILIALCKCLRQHECHHEICTELNQPLVKIQRISEASFVSNEAHDVFIHQLCFTLNRLYQKYEATIGFTKHFLCKKTEKVKDKVKPLYKNTFDHGKVVNVGH